jgi:uncharacterized protein (DUF1697 family)
VKKFSADIDIDFADREAVLKHIQHTPASINRNSEWSKHNTGIYVNPIPADPFTKLANIDYITAEDIGYIKLDLLNVHVYSMVRDESHLNKLIETEPMWEMLEHKEFVEKIIHINNHYDLLRKMPEPVDSIARMAMFIALIRPGKRHLVGKSWREVGASIWEKTEDAYSFKKSHSVAYAQLVAVHMNILTEPTN